MSTPTLDNFADLVGELTLADGGDTTWRHRAVCRNVDPDLFFPVATAGPAYERQLGEARMVCWPCPVRAKCLEWSVATRQLDGVWGGEGAPARREMILARARQQRETRKVAPTATARSERQARGLTLLHAGYAVADVAAILDVTEGTVTRWRQYHTAAVRAERDEAEDRSDVPPCGGCNSRLCEDCFGSLR